MKTIKIKANKKDIDYYNQLLEVSFDDYSLKNKKKIDKLNALQNDYLNLAIILNLTKKNLNF